MAENDMLTGYLAGQSDNNGGGMFGGDGGWIWALVILALLGGGIGFGGGMFGGGMMGGMYPMMMFNGMATRADINEGFQFNDLQNGIRGITNGLSDTTYALNNSINGVQSTLCQGFNGVNTAMLQGFNGVERGFCNIGHQISDCCCQTQRAIDGVNYNLATQTNALQQAMCNNTRDIIDSQNSGTRAILDFLTQDKISSLTAENQALKFAASQSQQNAYLTATIDAATAEVLRRSGHECPTAAYLVQPPTPVNFPTNGCGTVQFSNNYGGYGCGCGCAA